MKLPPYTIPEADADLWDVGRVFRENDELPPTAEQRFCLFCGEPLRAGAPMHQRYCSGRRECRLLKEKRRVAALMKAKRDANRPR